MVFIKHSQDHYVRNRATLFYPGPLSSKTKTRHSGLTEHLEQRCRTPRFGPCLQVPKSHANDTLPWPVQSQGDCQETKRERETKYFTAGGGTNLVSKRGLRRFAIE